MRLIQIALPTLLIIAISQNVSPLFKLTNLQCESFNKTWAVFHECRLRPIKRDIVAMNTTVELMYPAYQIDVNIELLKKANGYKPFLYNSTVDACAFMIKRNNPVLGLVYDLFKDFSNINHTCPLMGSQILRNFYPKHEIFKVPLPNGEYALWLTWYLHSKKSFVTKVYWSFVEKPFVKNGR